MRAIWAAAAVLAVFAVSACDINTGEKQAKVACNCTATPPPAAPPAPPAMDGAPGADVPPARHRPARHGAWHGTRGGAVHGYAWRREYAELSVQTYDYHSDSHSYYADGGARGYAGGGAHGEGHRGGRHWREGHGDARAGDAGAGDATVGDAAYYNPPPDDRARASVWHGYDADCPDDDTGRHHRR